jgi:hypothetical protein
VHVPGGLPVAALPGEGGLDAGGGRAQFLAQDARAAGAHQVPPVLPGGEQAAAGPDDAGQRPLAHVVAGLADQRGVAGVPGPAPHPDRDPVAGDGHPGDDLGQVRAGVLALAVAAEPRLTGRPAIAIGAGAAALLLPGQRLAGVPCLEIGGGGIGEQQAGFEVEQVGEVVMHLLAEVAFHDVQLVHRPVAGVVADRCESVDVHVSSGPAGGGQLAGRRQRTVSHQREQGPLQDGAIQPAVFHAAADHHADAQPPPQPVQHVGAAQRHRGHELPPGPGGRGQGRPGLQQPGQTGHQPDDGLAVQFVFPAEVVQHPGARPLQAGVPLVAGQLQVADHAAARGPRRGLHVGHGPEAIASPSPRENRFLAAR